MTRLASSILSLLVLAALTIVIGCNAEAKSSYVAGWKYTLYPDGKVEAEKRVTSGSSSAAPGPTSQPTLATAGSESAEAAASGSQMPAALPAFTYGLAQRQYIFYGLGSLCIIAGFVIGFWKRQYGLALGLGLAGATLLMAQTFIDIYAPWVLLAILLVAAGWAWAAFRDRHKIQSIEQEKRILEVRKTANRKMLKTAIVAAKNPDVPQDVVADMIAATPAGSDAAAELKAGQ